jgi:hypothetical protein
MQGISLEFPKTERKFYEFALKALSKVSKEDEKIYAFETADPKIGKTGFIVVGEKSLFLISMKGGLLGGATTEIIKYNSIKEVDFDIAPTPFGVALMNTGILYLKVKGGLGSKKRTIRNIPDYNLDSIVKAIRDRIK